MMATHFPAWPSPKQNGASAVGRHSWYPYYAGYSPVFVQKVLERANLDPTAVVCDPWNGSGTTTQVAHDLGYPTVGFDLNPVMVIVARSRSVMPWQVQTLRHSFDKIFRRVHTYHSQTVLQKDPLNLWMQPCATLAVRQLEQAIREETHNEGESPQIEPQPWDVSQDTAFFFTAVFRCFFRLSKKFRASNPTWFKIPRNVADRVSFTSGDLTTLFTDEVSQMFSSLEAESSFTRRGDQLPTARIEVASSDALPINNREVDIVITSPPYCTRIDYAVSTSLELAFLGFDYSTSVRRLREQMIGTSTIRSVLPEEDLRWGSTCNHFLHQVRNHSSKASQAYYLKTHIQYFHDIYNSLLELDRSLRSSSSCVLVVQDSYYKDVHNDLASSIAEMASSIQWEMIGRQDFPVRLSMAQVHRHSRRYRSSSAAVESVLWFKTRKP